MAKKIEVTEDGFKITIVLDMISPTDLKNRVSIDDITEYIIGELEDKEFWPPRERDKDEEPYVVNYATFPILEA